ncbi:MAG: orotidine-5'-phosphate decarboxylase [Patescibacteria group bacterium]
MENWLNEWEKDEVISKMIGWNLIRWDNKRRLRLKSGGTTDVFIMLRNVRNIWQAQEYFGRLFANPLARLGAERFIEVPSAVSGIASQISRELRKPYITVRDTPKEGRVANANFIGQFVRGEVTPIFDDVITNGASKLLPYDIAKEKGVASGTPIIVLCDRQQGWQKKFAELEIDVPVWAGFTLHDVRKRLIENSFMERCDKSLEEKNPLIVAHDGKTWDEMLPLLDELRPTGCIHKVNDALFNQGIENLMPNLQVYGRVMADLNSHDISHTVSNIMKHLVPCPPWAVTVHASGGREMISAAVDALSYTDTKILAVTVLTSFDSETCEEIYECRPKKQVKKLAQIAYEAGAHGFVCSPKEVSMLKRMYPNMFCITPGVRSKNADNGDQKRVATPVQAMENGADYLVSGRQISGAENPAGEVCRILTEELKIIKKKGGCCGRKCGKRKS